MTLLGMNRPCLHKPPGWKRGSRGVNKHMCNSNPLLVWLWAGGIMYEFRGFMCTSFLYTRMNERQVFTRFQACRQAPGCIPMFYHIHEWFCGAQRENEIQRWVEINHKCMYMKGTWTGLCIFFKSSSYLEEYRTSFVEEGCDYGALKNGVQCLTQSGTTKGLFLCFQITMEVKSDPGNKSRFPEINPWAASTLSMKRNWPFVFWSHRIPTNAVCPHQLWQASPPQPQT